MGVGWNSFGVLVNRLSILFSGIVVARFLSPKDYAIAGLAGGIMLIFNVVTSQGFNLALIREKNIKEDRIHSVFWFLTIWGIIGAVIIVFTAPLFSIFYGNSDIVGVLFVLAINLTIGMVSSVPAAMLYREMRFKEINIINSTSSIISSIIGILLAWVGFRYWAIIIPIIIITTIRCLAVLYISGYRPRIFFRWNEVRAISKLGFTVMGNRVIREFTNNGDSLILPMFWTSHIFGLYYFALQKSRQLLTLLNAQLSNVFLPAFSLIQEEPARIKSVLLKSTKMLCLVIYPLSVWLISVADIIIPLIFGEQWLDVIPVFRVFVAFGFVNAISMIIPDVMNAVNQPMKIFIFNIFRLVVVLPVLLLCGMLDLTMFQVSVVLFNIWYIQVLIFIIFIYNYLGITIKEFTNSVGMVIMASIIMGGASLICVSWARSNSIPYYLELIIVTIVPAILYVIINNRTIKELIMMATKSVQLKTAVHS